MAIDDNMERRTSLVLLQYWNQLRGDRPFPLENELDPDQISTVWDHCFLLQVRDVKHVLDYNFTYLGPDLVRAYDSGVLDRFNGRMISPDAHRSADLFNSVIETGEPLLDEGEYINPVGRIVRFRQAFMPVGHDDGRIHAILGGAWFRLAMRQAS